MFDTTSSGCWVKPEFKTPAETFLAHFPNKLLHAYSCVSDLSNPCSDVAGPQWDLPCWDKRKSLCLL